MSVISVSHLTKRYGPVLAVDDLSFDVHPGKVTGFLGPNGAGKTTTLRILLGLAAPTAGSATIGGAEYRTLPDPMRQVGAALDSNTSRTAGLARCWTRSGCPTPRAAGSAATRWACASGSAWPAPCLATPACSSWTSR